MRAGVRRVGAQPAHGDEQPDGAVGLHVLVGQRAASLPATCAETSASSPPRPTRPPSSPPRCAKTTSPRSSSRTQTPKPPSRRSFATCSTSSSRCARASRRCRSALCPPLSQDFARADMPPDARVFVPTPLYRGWATARDLTKAALASLLAQQPQDAAQPPPTFPANPAEGEDAPEDAEDAAPPPPGLFAGLIDSLRQCLAEDGVPRESEETEDAEAHAADHCGCSHGHLDPLCDSRGYSSLQISARTSSASPPRSLGRSAKPRGSPWKSSAPRTWCARSARRSAAPCPD